MEAGTVRPRFIPQIGCARRCVLTEGDPVHAIEWPYPQTAIIAFDLDFGRSAAKSLQLNVPIGCTVASKLVPGTDIVLTGSTQENCLQCACRCGNAGCGIYFIRRRVAVENLHVECRAGAPRFIPQIGGARSAVLGEGDPVRAIEWAHPQTAVLACDLNLGRSSTKTL